MRYGRTNRTPRAYSGTGEKADRAHSTESAHCERAGRSRIHARSNRSTVWNIMKFKHKLGRLNSKTARCSWANPDTPASVRAIIDGVLQANLLQSSERNND